MKFMPALLFFIASFTGSLMSMNPLINGKMFYIENDTTILKTIEWKNSVIVPKSGNNVRNNKFSDEVCLHSNSCKTFWLACSEAQKNMHSVHVLLMANDKEYLAKIQPVVAFDEHKKHFLVKMIPWDFEIENKMPK